MDAVARGNGLHACLKATSSLLVAVGWHKKVKVATTWEMTGRSGWKMTIETEAISQESQGMFPDTADPKLKPVFLELAHESVQMFLAQLAERGILPAATTAAPLSAPPCAASNESYLRSEVAPLAQTDFHCPREQIATRYLDTKCSRAEATGCGYTRQYLYGDSGWVGTADVSQVGGAQTLPYTGPAAPGPRPVPFATNKAAAAPAPPRPVGRTSSPQEACDGGDMKSCNDLGKRYDHRYVFPAPGGAKDDTRAVDLYRKACDGGFMPGCSNLGVKYQGGKGVAKDETRAISLYQKACDGGDMEGCGNLGVAYMNGYGVPKDSKRAVDLLQKACDGSFLTSCVSLASMYSAGSGVPKDTKRANDLLQKACQGGETVGCMLHAQ
jgi:hypothetical protein